MHGPESFTSDSSGNYYLGCLCGYVTPASTTATAAGAAFDEHIASSGSGSDSGAGGGKGT
jgi:hypothetical protein